MAALAPEWERLLRESPADSVFLTWDWIESWAVEMGQVRPRVVTARSREGDLLGVAPLYECRLRLGLLLPIRALRVLGDHPTSADYPDWPVRACAADEVLPALAREIAARKGWDLMWLPRMGAWNGSSDRIAEACRRAGLRCRTRRHDFASLPLPAAAKQYFASLSGNRRKQLRMEHNRLSRRRVEIVRCQKVDEIDLYLDALFDLHGRRWRRRGGRGSFTGQPIKTRFYRRFARVAFERDWLWLYGLRDEGEFKAVQIGYVYRGVFHQIQEGFDPDYEKGAGNVLRARIIEDCIRRGVRVYDFLAGASEHKRRWGGELRAGADLMIGSGSLASRLVFSAGLWPESRLLRSQAPRGRSDG